MAPNAHITPAPVKDDVSSATSQHRGVFRRLFSTFRNKHRLAWGIMLTLIGGSLWGMNATLSMHIMSCYHADPLWLACVRELCTSVLFLSLAAYTMPHKLHALLHTKKDMWMMLVMAFDVILMSQVSYLEAIARTNSATATVLQNLGVILVMIYVCVVNRRRPRKRELAGLILAVLGTYFIATGGDPTRLILPLDGFLWGMVGACAAALLSIQPLKYMHRYGNFAVNGLCFLFAGVILGCYCRPWTCVPAFDAAGWLCMVATVLVGTFGAYAFFLEGVKEVGSVRGVMLGTSEPLAATISACAVMGVMFSPGELLGFAMVIVMVFLTA